jgi:hypothetical protein
VGWSAVGSGLNGDVRALTSFDDGTGPALYAGGDFKHAGGLEVNGIARWDGQSWSALGGGLAGSPGVAVHALAVYDDGGGAALYAGGLFYGPAGVARWDGTSWSALGIGQRGTSSFPCWCSTTAAARRSTRAASGTRASPGGTGRAGRPWGAEWTGPSARWEPSMTAAGWRFTRAGSSRPRAACPRASSPGGTGFPGLPSGAEWTIRRGFRGLQRRRRSPALRRRSVCDRRRRCDRRRHRELGRSELVRRGRRDQMERRCAEGPQRRQRPGLVRGGAVHSRWDGTTWSEVGKGVNGGYSAWRRTTPAAAMALYARRELHRQRGGRQPPGAMGLRSDHEPARLRGQPGHARGARGSGAPLGAQLSLPYHRLRGHERFGAGLLRPLRPRCRRLRPGGARIGELLLALAPEPTLAAAGALAGASANVNPPVPALPALSGITRICRPCHRPLAREPDRAHQRARGAARALRPARSSIPEDP